MDQQPSPPIGASYLEPKRVTATIFTPELFSEEDNALAETAETFCNEEVWPRRAEIDQKVEGVVPGLMQRASELGLTMLDIPEAYDGLDLSVPVSMRVMEKTAREQSFMLSMMVQNGIGSQPVTLFGTEAQKSEWLPRFASGEKRGCYALTEPSSGSDALAAKATARLSEDGQSWILNGTKQFITNAGWADVAFVFARAVDELDGRSGFSCFIVPLDLPGASLGAEEEKLGMWGSSTRQIILDECRIPVANVLGELGRGHVIAFNILNAGRYKLGGTALGAAKYVFAAAISYAAERKQFGLPTISFGMMKRKVGQMGADIFAVESSIYRICGDIDAAARANGFDAGAKLAALQNHALECSIAKCAGSELLNRVADESLQMFGGYGFLEEYPAAKVYRDARISRIYEGTNEINRIVMPRTLLKKIADGLISLEGAGSAQGGDLLLALKQLHARCFETARASYGDGKGFDRDQETLANLADMQIDIHLLESSLLRVAQMAGAQPVHHSICQLLGLQIAGRVERNAVEILRHLGAADAIKLPAPAGDVLALRQSIADDFIEAGEYAL
ncbi:MAG: acyl-CoA dehydrogenase family protein [Gammaproteobacteria bacterium]|nr:acyl-CoA dehydrogenase family protein [Gammaproteobacteria bacterium]